MLSDSYHEIVVRLFASVVFICVISACTSSNGADQSSTSTADRSSVSRSYAASTQSVLSITGTPPLSVNVGGSYYFNVNAAGGSGSLSFTIKNSPSWATFNSSTGELHGTPTAAGTYSNILIAVTDGKTSAALPAFTVSVLSGSGSATLHWTTPAKNTDGTSLKDLSGYVIYYGTSASSLTKSITIGSSNAVSYTFSGLTKGTKYYFSIVALNALKMEGARSAVISITA